MGLLGGIVGGARGAAGSIFGGISASRAMRKARENVEAQRKSNQDWYDRRYNEDATQRADAQRILTRTEDSIRQRNQQAAGAQAVTGGSEESVAAEKAANSQALADAASQIAAAGERRKDTIEEAYRTKDDAYASQLNQIEQGKAKAIAGAAQGVAKAGAGIADLF